MTEAGNPTQAQLTPELVILPQVPTEKMYETLITGVACFTFSFLRMRKRRAQENFLPQGQFQEQNPLVRIPPHPFPPGLSLQRQGPAGGPAHPQPAPEDRDLAPSLLLALAPLHQVEAVVDGQCDVPLAHGGVHGARQQVGLRLQCHLHAVGQQQPQGAVCPDVVAVADLVCGSGRTDFVQKAQGWREAEV